MLFPAPFQFTKVADEPFPFSLDRIDLAAMVSCLARFAAVPSVLSIFCEYRSSCSAFSLNDPVYRRFGEIAILVVDRLETDFFYGESLPDKQVKQPTQNDELAIYLSKDQTFHTPTIGYGFGVGLKTVDQPDYFNVAMHYHFEVPT